jgi:hypothetical protein
MEGAPMNAIDTALLKAKSALRWRRPTSETNKMVRSGENLAPTFMNDFPQPGALPLVSLSVEHRVDRRLSAFLAVGAGHAHGAYDLPIDIPLRRGEALRRSRFEHRTSRRNVASILRGRFVIVITIFCR